MRVLVTGASGQLGMDVVQYFSDNYQVLGCSSQDMDITDIDQVLQVVNSFCPDMIIHGAAYTKVDLAEQEKDRAYLINAYGTRNIAVAAQKARAKLVYISTDYVFNGSSAAAYHEFDQPDPISIYGKSKLAGEEFVKQICDQFFIVRTSWLYGKNGHNFVKTMLKIAKEKGQVSVVDDQIGSPTYTEDLVKFLQSLIVTDKFGLYHASNTGSCSWYEFAQAIFAESGMPVKVAPIKSGDFPQLARRPSHAILDHMAIRSDGFKELRHWREALKDFLTTYVDAIKH